MPQVESCLNRKTLLPKARLVKMYMCSLLSKEVKVVFFVLLFFCKYNFSKSEKFPTAVTNSLTDFLRMLLANTVLDFFCCVIALYWKQLVVLLQKLTKIREQKKP